MSIQELEEERQLTQQVRNKIHEMDEITMYSGNHIEINNMRFSTYTHEFENVSVGVAVLLQNNRIGFVFLHYNDDRSFVQYARPKLVELEGSWKDMWIVAGLRFTHKIDRPRATVKVRVVETNIFNRAPEASKTKIDLRF